MNEAVRKFVAFVSAIVEKAKVRKGLVSVAAVAFFLQLYFVRELLAAEALFMLGFAVLFVIGGIVYLVGALGERGLDFAEAGIRMIADSARRGYSGLEEITRKSLGRPRSESAL